MNEWTRLQRYVGYTEEDGRALGAVADLLTPRIAGITERFYEATLRDEQAAALFADMAQVDRLKGTLRRWIDELFRGPHDDAYRERRLNIGRVHVRIGMPHYYMFTAMNLLRDELVDALESLVDDPDLKARATRGMHKMLDLELSIMLGTYIEARERKELEDFRALIFTHIPVTVFFLDDARNVVADTALTPRLCLPGAAKGRALDDVLHPELIAAADLHARLDELTDAPGHQEIVLPRVDARVGDEVVSARFTIIDLHHSVARTLVYCEDLTDTVRGESRQRDAENLARLGTMAATVAHEIRNPLAGISSTIQVVSGSLEAGDPRKDPLDKVLQQVVRLGDLVGDLLNFARPIRVQLTRGPLLAAVTQGVRDADAAADRVSTIDGETDATVDPGLLAQVVLNLVQNAWQAGARTVRVTLKDARVQVVDDGPGVKQEDRARIFDPFMTTKVRGTGLGLSLAHRAVEEMGGQITLRGTAGGGATFELKFKS